MRYRAKNDFISIDLQGDKILVAKGDKVYVQQLADGWEAYSFHTRKLVGRFNTEDFDALFDPEHAFQKPPREDRFKGRNFRSSLMAIFITLLPFISSAQVNPITWDWKAVRVDANHFEFQLRASISRGWWVYAPNRQDECPYSPIITFERSRVMKPIEKVVVLEYLIYANNEITEGTHPPFCPIPQYRSSVVFMQLFKMPIDSSGIVKGQITFQAMSKYIAELPITIDFELNVGADSHLRYGTFTTARIITTYPKGIFRKTWWFIRHPFGPCYISKKYYP